MLRRSGQAAAELGRTLHWVCEIVLTVAVLLSLVAIGLTWRLSRGPLELNFLKDRVERAVNKSLDPVHVTIGDVSIAWAGFSHGLDQPLILRVADLTVEETASTARARVPLAEAGLSVRALLTGRLVPRSITLDGARLALLRKADGSVGVDLGNASDAPGTGEPSSISGLLAVLGAPVWTDLQTAGDRFSQLSTVSIHNARLLLNDRLLGLTWSARRADIDLSRHPGGGMDGRAKIVLGLAGQNAELTANFNLPPGARSAHVAAHMSRVTPKSLAEAAPVLAGLAALDAAVILDGEADLGPNLEPTHIRLTARSGPGKINAANGLIPVNRAELVVSGDLDHATLESAVVEFQPGQRTAVSTLRVSGGFARLPATDQPMRVSAALHLTIDQADFADLPILWPPDVSPHARDWITQNIPSGTARDGKADIALETSVTGADVTLNHAAVSLEGQDLSVTWLPTVPPAEQVRAHLVLTDPDKLEIDVKSGRQKVRNADPIALRNGHVTISGLTAKDQTATIKFDANGPVASAITLLKEPRLRILDRHPVDLRAPSGDARLTFQLVVPLLLGVQFDDVALHGSGSLNKVHLTGIVAGRDLDDAAVALDVDTNHLSIKGTGRLAGIPASIHGMMDFRAGPPSQVLQRYAVTGKATARALADAGLDTGDVATGEAALNVVLNEYRSGEGELTVDADLTQAALTASPLGWRKPAGAPMTGTARLTLSKDRLTGIDRVAIDGPGTQVRGAVTAAGGKLDTVRLDRVLLGRTDIRGTVQLPGRAGNNPISADMSGPVLDLSAKLVEKPLTRDRAAPEPPPGPAWSMRGRFDRVTLAHDQSASQVAVAMENDGSLYQSIALTGKTGSGKPFSVRVGPGQVRRQEGGAQQNRRIVAISVEDAGSLLRGLDVTETIQGGTLTVTADFDDGVRNHPLSGTLEMNDFRLTRAALLGKLLQSLTLYGLVDALDGSGLHFSRLIAPFQLDDETITLHAVRAFSPSLGLTAKGRMDRSGERIDFEGTVVPAYVFNSLLGRLPLIGGLFRAEQGGGLIAMNYSIRGPATNPTVLANPLSALTPGILRGMFGLFDRAPLDQAAPESNAQVP